MIASPSRTAVVRAEARPPSLRRNFAWTLIGNLIHSACGWGLIVAIARLGGPDALGRYSLGMAIATPVFAFTGLNLRSAMVSDVRERYSFFEYFLCRSITAGLALILTIAIGAASVHGSRDTLVVIIAVAAWNVIASMSDVFYGLLQKHERMGTIALSLALKGTLGLAALATALYYTRSVATGVGASMAVRGAILLFYDVPRSWRCPRIVRYDATGFGSLVPNQVAMFIWCVPLAIHCMLQSLVENVPRYFIEANNGTRMLGMFSAIAALISGGGTVVSALGQSAYPRLALLNARDAKGAFDRLLIGLMLVAGGLGGLGVLAAALFGREILTLLYKAEYAAFAPEFVWLMVAGGIGYVSQFPGYALSACGRFAFQVPLIGSVAVTAIIASFYLVPRYSLRGAAMALALATLVQLAGGLAGLRLAPTGGRAQRVGSP